MQHPSRAPPLFCVTFATNQSFAVKLLQVRECPHIDSAWCFAHTHPSRYGARTTLWGLQRPPLGTVTELRAGKDTTLDDFVLHLLPFHMTNASEQVAASVHPENSEVWDFLHKMELTFGMVQESEGDFASRIEREEPWNVVQIKKTDDFPMVAHFVSLLFPLGHIKSVKSNDSVSSYDLY